MDNSLQVSDIPRERDRLHRNIKQEPAPSRQAVDLTHL